MSGAESGKDGDGALKACGDQVGQNRRKDVSGSVRGW